MDEIRNISKNEEYPVGRWGKLRTYGQKFSDDIMIKRGGKEQSLKEFTNNNAKETTIYEVLDIYRGDLKLTEKAMLQHANAISDELGEVKSMTDALKIQKEANERWNTLPRELRAEFGNSKENFLKNGGAWAKAKIAEENARLETIKKAQAENQKLTDEMAKKYAEREAKIDALINGSK